MSLHVVNGEKRNTTAITSFNQLIEKLSNKYTGTIYYGFALSEIDNTKVVIDALMVTEEKGLLAINFSSNSPEKDIDDIDRVYVLLRSLLEKNSRLRKRRELAIDINVINFSPSDLDIPQKVSEDYVSEQNFLNFLENKLKNFDSEYYKPLNEALDKVVSAKPKKMRNSVKKGSSLGSKIKKIELEVANMDQWQRTAAYEIPDTPQRIRGLAGSGKTVVLALKAAYLHFMKPEADIAVTFYSRALYQQFRSLIQEFYQQYSQGKVDFDKVHIMHAWGTLHEPGMYSKVAVKIDANIYTYKRALSDFGEFNAFNGVCKDVLMRLNMKDIDNLEMYDYILIDEAQDFPPSFFLLVYKLFKSSEKRIVYAYDELQTLNKSSMPPLEQMFGTDESGKSLVDISNDDDLSKPRTDIVLPICYRNSRWALTIAHALGFGIYRNVEQPLVQFFEDLDVWKEIGYEKTGGTLEFDHRVKLKRKNDASPQYFEDLLNPQDAVFVHQPFSEKSEEYNWLTKQIKKNIEEDELDPDDILVIFPDTRNSYKNYEDLSSYLQLAGIDSIMPGKNVDRDTFTVKGHITCTHIHRAKGNERPMVYLVDGEYGDRNIDLISVRNTLFTAITRSRAWVRISGTGIGMRNLKREIEACVQNDYILDFKIPNKEEIEKINLLNKMSTTDEKNKVSDVEKATENLLDMLKDGQISMDAIPQLKDLLNVLDKKEEE